MPIETRLTKELIDEYTNKGYWGKISFLDHLGKNIEKYPDKEALVDKKKRLTFKQWGLLVHRLALGFLELGIKEGDNVIIQTPNWVEFPVILFALGKIGAVTVPVGIYLRERELDYILRFTEAKTVIIPSEFKGFDHYGMVRGLRSKLPVETVLIMGDEMMNGTISIKEMMENRLEEKYPEDYLDKYKPRGNDIFFLLFTSGTEADPKGTLITHNNSLFSSQYPPFTEKDVAFPLIPLTTALGMHMGFFVPFLKGAKIVLLDIFQPREALNIMVKERVTVPTGVPAQFIAILSLPDIDRYQLPPGNHIATSGAPCPSEVIRKLREKLGFKILNYYGSSEVSLCTFNRLDDPVDVLAETIGRHPEGYQIKIVDDEGRELPKGERGEIMVKSPSLFAGYYKDPGRTKQAFDEEGWYHTGDLGILREDGNLCIAGRKKDVIIRGGRNISPVEVEDLLHSHPKIQQAAMVGMPDERLGEKNCIYVVPKSGEKVTLEELIDFLKERKIAAYKLPERLEIRNNLPITPAGKIRKNELKADIAKNLGIGVK
ncbi:MAG: AMP-binding protein [Thermodesulfobacteriota bacterium]|nr:AMP-binding protein [Thermodesulfobacteriota bacterium]